MTERIRWNDVPCVELELPPVPQAECPFCDSVSHRFIRSIKSEGDGSSLRLMVCRECLQAFKILAYYADADEFDE